MFKLFSRCKRKEDGQSMVEFALVLLPLLLLVMGIIEFGWLFNAQITATSAAREGARYAAVHQYADEDDIREVVVRHATTFKPEDIEVDADWDNPPEVVIMVDGNIEPLIGFFVRKDTVNLKGAATMRLEYLKEENSDG